MIHTKLILLCISLRDFIRKSIFYATSVFPPYKPKRGITIVAHLTDGASLSKVMRDLAHTLKDSNIPFQTWDLCRHPNVPRSDVAGILTPKWKFRARKYDHVIEMFRSPFPKLKNITTSSILFWEFDSGFPELSPDVLNHPSVIGMSDFNANYFRKIMPASTSVVKVLYPFRRISGKLPESTVVRRKYGIDAKDFAVFFNFDLSSGIERKNPHGAMLAFAKAFHAHADTKLIFKVLHARQHPNAVAELKQLSLKLGIEKNFIIIAEYLPIAELYGLTSACDCYLSLHRGEGFGLGIAEAMSLGKPVIVTNYSASTEFCNPTNSIPIGYTLKTVPPDSRKGFLQFVDQWADPDIDAAAQALQSLYQSPELRNRLGSAAQAFIADHFSPDNFRKSVDAFLAESAVSQPRSRS